ncbi:MULTISPECIES: helix-turn-helix domain-containing protein [Clostridiaceae]|uniref:Helix-turn-helix transcriptional regulator n=1 Tax=Clostridium facile TaxID=2763035 RepID=A0ABR7IQI8_9CLOT|nr:MULTISPECIES: helix-turn-helix transcriptional regulator [Clostridiaceae]MBC5787400.1 helix-turn-helix transcriptional regulator [Clostridium facile]
MYKNRNNGRNNVCGKKIARLRQERVPKTSQRALADLLQLEGIDLDKNAIQRIESGKRFVTDIELRVFAKIFGITAEELLQEDNFD